MVLENTFIHIQGIGTKTEQTLWKKGIRSWSHFMDRRDPVFSAARDRFVREELALSVTHRQDIRFFAERLSSHEMWRVFDAFKAKAVYLDIETSGGYEGTDEITVIGLYDGNRVRSFINGINLEDFETAVAAYDLVVTFNGACFDIPYIRRWFPNICLPPGHIDLRFLFKKLGYQGGLKKIEKDFGISRDHAIDGMSGYEAVTLWQAYQWGDHQALQTLIQYNQADIVNLKPLMEIGYAKMKNSFPYK